MGSFQIPLFDLTAEYKQIKKELTSELAVFLERGNYMDRDLIDAFEKDFAKYIRVQHCIGAANGTDALEIALEAVGIGPGDEVIVPAMSWVSTASAVSRLGATPIFVDILVGEHTLDPEKIEFSISSRTKAIIPVHLYGFPARMHSILKIARDYSLRVIEDCAQAHGAAIRGKKVGSFGDLATFSFYPTKNLGAFGDAGAIVANDPDLSKRIRLLANLGMKDKQGQHELVGRNSRMDALQALVLRIKLRYLDEWIAEKNRLAKKYARELWNVGIPICKEGFLHAYHLYVIESKNRDVLQKELTKKGIETKVHYPVALPFLKCYEGLGYKKGDFPVAEKLAKEALSVPVSKALVRDYSRIFADHPTTEVNG